MHFQFRLPRKASPCSVLNHSHQLVSQPSPLAGLHDPLNQTRLNNPNRYLNWKQSFCNCQSLPSCKPLGVLLLFLSTLLFPILLPPKLHLTDTFLRSEAHRLSLRPTSRLRMVSRIIRPTLSQPAIFNNSWRTTSPRTCASKITTIKAATATAQTASKGREIRSRSKRCRSSTKVPSMTREWVLGKSPRLNISTSHQRSQDQRGCTLRFNHLSRCPTTSDSPPTTTTPAWRGLKRAATRSSTSSTTPSAATSSCLAGHRNFWRWRRWKWSQR